MEKAWKSEGVMSEQMTVTYGGVVVAYVEKDNKWKFTLRGRERSAESLAAAKAAIDKPEPKSKSFERMKAIRSKYDGFLYGDITSIAEPSKWSNKVEVWFSAAGSRDKVNADELYEDSPKNRDVIEEIAALQAEIERLETKAEQKQQAMARVSLPTA